MLASRPLAMQMPALAAYGQCLPTHTQRQRGEHLEAADIEPAVLWDDVTSRQRSKVVHTCKLPLCTARHVQCPHSPAHRCQRLLSSSVSEGQPLHSKPPSRPSHRLAQAQHRLLLCLPRRAVDEVQAIAAYCPRTVARCHTPQLVVVCHSAVETISTHV